MTVKNTRVASLLFSLCAACGGAGEKRPNSPSEEASVASKSDANSAANETEAPKPESSTVDGPPGPSGGRSPQDIVGAESTRFVLSFTSSDVGMKAEEQCDMRHSSDPKKRNQCMKSASTRVKEHVMQFEQNKTAQWVWTTSNQKGNMLSHLRQFKFTWGEETKNSVVIHPSKGPQVKIGVPNNYSIAINHPTHGRLVYDAKVTDN